MDIEADVKTTSSANVQNLVDALVYICDGKIKFGTMHLSGLALVAQDASLEEIKYAFRKFYSELPEDYKLRYGAKDFIEQGPQLIRLRRNQIEAAKQSELDAEEVRRQIREAAQKRMDETNRRIAEELAGIEEELVP